MSLSIEGNSQAAEALVDTLTVEGTTLADANLSALTTNDLEQLAQLSQELHLSTEMDTEGSEASLLEIQEVQSEVGQPEIGAQEVEIETERAQSPEEILPDVKIKSTVPPLRPLTIAPKPTKVPITLKSAGGQQLLLLQGSGTGQPLKIVSSQGQGISVTNLSLGKPLTLRPAAKGVTANSMSVLQPKQVIMKKVIQPQKTMGDAKNIVVTEKLDTQIKSTQGNIVLPTPAKTITLAQAQQIGLLTGAKIVPQVATKQAIVVNKTQNKAIKIIPQGKPHTKILPAPQINTANKTGQRIILKQTNAVTPGQIIQVTGSQPLLTGQLHQINIPGKGVQYIKIVTPTTNAEGGISNAGATNITARHTIQTSSIENKVPVLSAVTTSGTTKATNVVLTEAVGATNIQPKSLKTVNLTRPNTVHLPTSGQLVMLPANYIPQATTAKVAIPAKVTTSTKTAVNETGTTISDMNLESNGMRPRKPCNCTKSQCLKLYCDCFANGEFCYLCNCMNCFNNLDNEEHRQRAIKSCLERNPNAFRPKIGKARDTGDTAVRKHTKGCNCKRSGCLKNYCECYEAKIACSSNCKCLGCRNIEDSMDKKGVISHQTNVNNIPIPISPPLISKLGGGPRNLLQFRPRRHSNNKHAFSFITDDVIEATSQCLLTISDSGEASAQDEELTKRQIIEEFGRCLMEIIECSMNRNICNTVN